MPEIAQPDFSGRRLSEGRQNGNISATRPCGRYVFQPFRIRAVLRGITPFCTKKDFTT
jgi:hypothetical protein